MESQAVATRTKLKTPGVALEPPGLRDRDLRDARPVAVVIPCYRVTGQILALLASIGPEVDHIILVDDACPDKSGDYVRANFQDPRLTILQSPVNQGVGGAVLAGYAQAARCGAAVAVKLDGDGQMDPALITRFVGPILAGKADYTKGNRFYNIEDVKMMPKARVFGNAMLSFMTKLSSGYWSIFDPTNGYTAISVQALQNLPLDKISKRYFFECDLLFRLGTIRAVVADVPMKALYGDEVSGLRISKIIGPFFVGQSRNFLKRIFYTYFLRDFSIATLQLIVGLAFLIFGVVFGAIGWYESATTGQPASTGTVMVAALPIIVGSQLLLSFLSYDMANAPNVPMSLPTVEALPRLAPRQGEVSHED